MAVSTVAGVRFSDAVAALLDHAIASGWRVEKDTRGRNAKGVLVYSSDKTVPPITVEEKGAKFNRPHYENIRRDLYRAGLPPLPADAVQHGNGNGSNVAMPDGVGIMSANSAEEALAGLPPGSEVLQIVGPDGGPTPANLERLLADAEKAPQFIGKLTQGLARQAGLGQAESDLVEALVEITVDWALINNTDRLKEAVDVLRIEVEAKYEEQINEALALAAEAEQRLAEAEAQRARSEERERKARTDCGEALRRADEAEARAKELEGAIAPLRKLLGSV